MTLSVINNGVIVSVWAVHLWGYLLFKEFVLGILLCFSFFMVQYSWECMWSAVKTAKLEVEIH